MVAETAGSAPRLVQSSHRRRTTRESHALASAASGRGVRLGLVGAARGDGGTGDPRADGALNNVHSTSFKLAAGSDLVGDGHGWKAGDQILGVGASSPTSAALDGEVRFLAMFGSDGATFGASSSAPTDPTPHGVGAGRNSGVVVEIQQVGDGRNPRSHAADAGKIVLTVGTDPADARRPASARAHAGRVVNGDWDDAVLKGKGLDTYGVAKIICNLDGDTGLPSNFEVYLNVSLLGRIGHAMPPAPGDGFMLAVQRQGDYHAQATGTIPRAVAEPSLLLILASLGLGGLSLSALRRHFRFAFDHPRMESRWTSPKPRHALARAMTP